MSLGQHLTPPEGCPDMIKSLMLSCWNLCPTERITFSKIVELLSKANIKTSAGQSNSSYHVPINYDQNHSVLWSKQGYQQNKTSISNAEERRPEGAYSLHKSPNTSHINSKHSSSPLLPELLDDNLYLDLQSSEFQTQYTVILASEEEELEED